VEAGVRFSEGCRSPLFVQCHLYSIESVGGGQRIGLIVPGNSSSFHSRL
jgi:hypothetical protein